MAGNPSNLLFSNGNRPAPGDRWYAAILVGCLSFLFAAAWVQSPISGYQAKAIIALSRPGARTREQLDHVLPPDERVRIERWFQAQGIIARWHETATGARRLQLASNGKTEDSSVTNLDATARQFSSEYFQRQSEAARKTQLAQQRSRLAEARLQEDLLERDIGEAISDLQSATTEADAAWRQATEKRAKQVRTPARRQVAPPPPPPPPPKLNPEWKELSASLSRQKAERSRLLLRFTTGHPLAVTLESQIAATQSELAATSQYLENGLRTDDEQSSPSADSPEIAANESDELDLEITEDGPSQEEEVVSPLVGEAPEYALGTLTNRVENLRRELAIARDARSRAELELVETMGLDQTPQVVASLTEPVTAEMLGGEMTRSGLMAAALVAFLAGSAVWTAYRGFIPERLCSGFQVERRLALRLLSTVRIAVATTSGETSPGERYIWWFLRGCEGTLVLLFALAIVTLIADSQLSQMFVADPLRAAGHVMVRWR